MLRSYGTYSGRAARATAAGEGDAMDRWTVAGMLRRNVAARGDDPMFRFGGATVTWGEHHMRACRVAHALAAEGVGRGTRVAFLDRNGLAFFEVLFGGAMCGAVNVAVNWRPAPTEMAAVIDDARAEVLVVHPEFVPCLTAMESGLPSVSRVVVLGDAKAGGERGGASDLARRVGYEDWMADRGAHDTGYEGGTDDIA